MNRVMSNVVLKLAFLIAVLGSSLVHAAAPPILKLSDVAGNVVTIDSTGTVAFSGSATCTAGTPSQPPSTPIYRKKGHFGHLELAQASWFLNPEVV